MEIVSRVLPQASIGMRRELLSLHYGRRGDGPKAYLQASLHADELPGMLVIHHLRRLLDQAEAAGLLRGEIVLAPAANPIGLAQALLHQQPGRFELRSGENFNRRFTDFHPLLRSGLEDCLGNDADANLRTVRARMRAALDAQTPVTELDALRLELSRMALDSDLVLDLHCDSQALLHLYADTPFWPALEPLARYLGVAAVVLNDEPGGTTFEESCGQSWWRLAGELGPAQPLPLGCVAATVELRGQGDLDHGQARWDAEALYAYLQLRGHIGGCAPAMPPPVPAPWTWRGMASVSAPTPGLVLRHCAVGAEVKRGQPLLELIDPLENRVTPVLSPAEGLLYVSHPLRYTQAGMELCRILGRADASARASLA